MNYVRSRASVSWHGLHECITMYSSIIIIRMYSTYTYVVQHEKQLYAVSRNKIRPLTGYLKSTSSRLKRGIHKEKPNQSMVHKVVHPFKIIKISITIPNDRYQKQFVNKNDNKRTYTRYEFLNTNKLKFIYSNIIYYTLN